MLKGIPSILPPELLKALYEMGHGDTLVIADGNFPAVSVAESGRKSVLVRMDAIGAAQVLSAVLKLFPLDQYVEHSVTLMEVVPGDCVKTPIWDTYKTEIASAHDKGTDTIRYIERFAFYREAEKASVIIATGEKALYANLILQKGVVVE